MNNRCRAPSGMEEVQVRETSVSIVATSRPEAGAGSSDRERGESVDGASVAVWGTQCDVHVYTLLYSTMYNVG